MQNIHYGHGTKARRLPFMAIVAVLGTGNMGAAIARRLVSTGHEVRAWNRTAARLAANLGASGCGTPAEAVKEADVVITMLTDAAAVEAVLFGPNGAAPHLRAGTCVVQMSTIGLQAGRDIAGRLPGGIELLDAPVTGSVDAAGDGTLGVLASGPATAVTRVRPVLEALGTVHMCGPFGAGTALKLVLNTGLVTAMAALADTLAVADAVGVDRDTALDALAAGPLGGAVKRATARGASFSFALAAKDIDLALDELDRGHPVAVVRAAAHAMHSTANQSADIGTIITKEHT